VQINEKKYKGVKNLLIDDPILHEFHDVFMEEIQKLPPRKDI
jgi:hypothetical protein